MATRGLTTVVLVLTGACAAPAAQAPKPAPAVARAAAAAPIITPPPANRPPDPAAPPARASDTCGAAPLQSLVGRPRTEIPVPLLPGARRVVCSTCPMTQDYLPGRQTIIYDATSGLVTSIKCG